MAQLAQFNPPTYQQELENSYIIDVHPLADLGHNAPIEFIINGDDDYINLNATALSIKAKIVKADGSAYPAETAQAPQNVAFINNAMHSMFEDVIVTINDEIVEGGNKFYT
jgi:hypothetical protein